MGTLISMQEAKTAEMSFSDHLEIKFLIFKNSVQKNNIFISYEHMEISGILQKSKLSPGSET